MADRKANNSCTLGGRAGVVFRGLHPVGMSAPGPLRRTAALIVVAAGITATAATAGTIRMNTDVHAIATDAAPGAALAAELYFALSDLDNQVATLIMLGGDERLATNRLDALRTY